MIDHDTMMKLLLTAEARIHTQGWDKPPVLSQVMKHPQGSLTLSPTVTAIPHPAGEYLLHLAQAFTERQDIPQGITKEAQDIVGLAFCSEAWANDSCTTMEAMLKLTDNRRIALADIPGSYESRDLTIVDAWGRIFHLHRQRGREPEMVMSPIGGRITIALTQMMIQLTQYLPQGSPVALSMTLIKLVNRADRMAAGPNVAETK